MSYLFLIVLFVGVVIRLIFVGNTGFIADISFWKSWGLAAIDHGIVWTAHNTNINYPPGFIYVLWLMGKLYSLFGDPHDYNTFWRENNFGFLLASKSIAIVSDIIIACIIYWFFSQKKKLSKLGAQISNIQFSLPLLLSSIFFLNPVVIIDSALWGQVESFGILFTILAIILIFYRRPVLATAFFTVGILMKLQNIIYIPLFFLFLYRYYDLKTMLRSLGMAVFTFFLVVFPFVLARDLNRVLYLLTINSDYFPWLSLNAHNIWWIVSKAAGMQITDKITVLGILNAKTTGLLLFSASYLLSFILLYLRPTPRNFLFALAFGIFSFFLFTTQSHERYSYPIIVLLLFFYPFIETSKLKSQKSKVQVKIKNLIKNTSLLKMGEVISSLARGEGWREAMSSLDPRLAGAYPEVWRSQTAGTLAFEDSPSRHPTSARFNRQNPQIRISNQQKYFWFVYVLLTAAVFFNIHTGLIANYPQNGIQILTRLTTPSLTIVSSCFHLFLFLSFLPFIFSQISVLTVFVPLIALTLGLLSFNASYLINSQTSLTKFKPVMIKQDYGVLQVNKNIGSAAGWKEWHRLSDNYFFYTKGFGTHANSNLVFDIDRKFSKFATDYGVDTDAPVAASVIFQIYGDGQKLFESEKKGRFDFPGHTEINVTGVKHLGLVVTDAGDGINSDHADWFNPMLYK